MYAQLIFFLTLSSKMFQYPGKSTHHFRISLVPVLHSQNAHPTAVQLIQQILLTYGKYFIFLKEISLCSLIKLGHPTSE